MITRIWKKPEPVNSKRQRGPKRPVPPVGTIIQVGQMHLYRMNSSVPAVRIRCGEDGVWSTLDPRDYTGLIVFINERTSLCPRNIEITEVQPTVVFAREADD